VLAAALTASCNNEPPAQKENKDLLSTDLVDNPRTAAGTDTAALASLATMDFRDTVFDFGTIREGEVVTHDFEFTNNGKRPLVISSANGSCGCTVADYPSKPVQPGETAKIPVRFSSSGKPGHQEKTVTIVTNSRRGNHYLFMKGEVTPKEEE